MVHDCKEVNGLDLMTRMEEELEAREVEVSKMLKRITDFAGGLDETVGLGLRSEIRFDEEEQLFVWRKADGGIQLAYEKGRLARLRDSIWRLVAHGRVSASGDSDTLNHYVEDVMHVERERRQLERENVMSKYKVEYVLRRLAKKSELYALQAKAVRDASSKHSQLGEQMTLLKNQLAEATSKAEKKASDAQALQSSIDRARAQLDNQRNLHAELQRRAKKLEQEKASGLRRLEELRATSSGLKSQLAEAIKRLTQTEKEQVVATLQSREEEIARLKRESHEIYDSKAEAIQRVAQLESQLAASEETVEQLMKQAHALNAALTEMQQPEGTVGRLQNRVRELQAATAELESMRTEICRLRDELQAANLRLSETQMATMQLNAPGTSSSQAVYQAELKHFSEQLYATLVGRAEGYNSIEQLLAEFKEWSGMDGEAKARSVGYISFLDFLRSSEMLERVVIVEEPELGVVYKARQRAEIAHIQQAQAISADHAMRKLRVALQVEEEKVMTLRTNIDTLSAFVEQKKRAIEELEKQVLCRVCMARNNNVVFDCGHVACSICTQRLAKCPMQCPGALVQRPLFL